MQEGINLSNKEQISSYFAFHSVGNCVIASSLSAFSNRRKDTFTF